MDCRTAEGMVNSYIARTLSDKEMESFLNHIENCSSCYEELETYYIVHEATRQLSTDQEDIIYDFKGLLEAEISKTKAQIRLNRLFQAVAYILTGTAVTGFLVYFIKVIIALI